MTVDARVAGLIETEVARLGFALVRISFGGGARPVLQVMAERDDGTLTIDDCASISRALSSLLDVEDPIPGEYNLEVSSPGIDRPLTRPMDYDRWAGFEAKVTLKTPLDGRKRFAGELAGLDDARQHALLDTPEGRVALPLDGIEQAKLVLTDELIRAALKAQGGGVDFAGLGDDIEVEVEDDAADNDNDPPAPPHSRPTDTIQKD